MNVSIIEVAGAFAIISMSGGVAAFFLANAYDIFRQRNRKIGEDPK